MSLFPKTCPFCDAGPGRYVNSYLCGTYLRAGVDARKHQTKRCVTGQMYAFVERARKADARCKRLEEAARAVYLDSIASDHPWTEPETRNMRALRDVLEAKP